MRSPLIPWVDAACRSWGHAVIRRRQAYSKAEGEPACRLRGDAGMVEAAIERAGELGRMPDRALRALYLHYCYRGAPVKTKLREIGVTTSGGYYYHVAKAHRIIDNYWPTDLYRE
jgi:hypothetical protein